jgi:transcription elongation factor Elf1
MMEEPIEKYKPAEKLDLKEIKDEFPKAFTKVYCPSCSEVVVSDNLNLQNSVAKCSTCNVIFSINEQVKSVNALGEMKQEVLRPEGIDLFYYRDDLDITVQHHIQGLDVWGLSLFPVIALFTIFLFFVGKLSIPYIPIAFSIGAFYFIYRAFNYTKNKTYIDVNNKFLSIKSRPKHFKKDKTYNIDEIDQLYIKYAVEGTGYLSIYMIINSLEGQKHKKLMTVNTLSKAKYLEQEIERYLNIENRKVPEANA